MVSFAGSILDGILKELLPFMSSILVLGGCVAALEKSDGEVL